MKRFVPMLLLTLFAAVSASATCTFDVNARIVSGDTIRLTWEQVPGATLYRVVELGASNSRTERHRVVAVQGTGPLSFSIKRQAASTKNFEYLVYAEKPGDETFAACVGDAGVTLSATPLLERLARNLYVPLVGSTRGANGSDFRTSLRIDGLPGMTGRIYFRPVGTTPSAADPSLLYSFPSNISGPQTVYYEDVVAAMGASGLGTLEIVTVSTFSGAKPTVTARIYNVTPNGTFGSFETAVRGFEYLQYRDTSQAGGTLAIPPVEGNFRRNVGFRTLTEVHYFATVLRADGTSQRTELRTVPADFTWFGTLDEFAGTPVGARDRVVLNMVDGFAISFYTVTENQTNDPTIVVKVPQPVDAQDLEDVLYLN